MKRFRIVAGPNGSGKTTLRKQLAADYAVNFYEHLNADDLYAEIRQTGAYAPMLPIAQEDLVAFATTSAYGEEVRRPFQSGGIVVRDEVVRFAPSAVTSYTVALLANFLQAEYVRRGVSLSMETVFSHPSKLVALEAARAAGYRTYLYYVATETPLLNVARVANRVGQGGHNVPIDKIRARYERSLAQIPPALPLLSRAYFFDNSGETMRYLAEWDGEKGTLRLTSPDPLPAWFAPLLAGKDARLGDADARAPLATSAEAASRAAIARAFSAGQNVAVWRGGRPVLLHADGREEALVP